MLPTALQAVSGGTSFHGRAGAHFRAVPHLVCREMAQNTHSLCTEAPERGKNRLSARRNLCVPAPVRFRAPSRFLRMKKLLAAVVATAAFAPAYAVFAQDELPSFAPVIKRAAPAVVNIGVKGTV